MCQPSLPPSDLAEGLVSQPPTIPCRFLYDSKGSQIYSEITELPEYTPYRAELGLLQQHAAAIVAHIPPGAMVVELGCGDATKTCHLIHALLHARGTEGTAYVGIDVSGEALRQTARTLRAACPDLPPSSVQLVEADYLVGVRSVRAANPQSVLCLLWLGSSVGNFEEGAAAEFLAALCAAAGGEAHVLLGCDDWKQAAVLHNAYCDGKGVTRRFIVNGIQNALRTLGHPDAEDDGLWRYDVVINPRKMQVLVEMYVAPKRCIEGVLPGLDLQPGQQILVEVSRKFTEHTVAALAEQAGLAIQDMWRTPGYSLQLLLPAMHALRSAWADTDSLFAGIADWSARPIDLRHPFLFYYGHLASFARSHLSPGARPSAQDVLFSRGIDPCVTDPSICHQHPDPPPAWPAREEVERYARAVRQEVELLAAVLPSRVHALHMVLEHERMHQETLCYMIARQRAADWLGGTGTAAALEPEAGEFLRRCSYRGVNKHADGTHELVPNAVNDRDPCNGDARDAFAIVPGGQVQLGVPRGTNHGFIWDNEMGTPPPMDLAPLLLGRQPVSVAQYKAFVENAKPYDSAQFWSAPDWAHIRDSMQQRPSSWIHSTDGRLHVCMPEAVYAWEEVAHCPVYVSLAEAEAYAKWAGGRIMSEEEHARAVRHCSDQRMTVNTGVGARTEPMELEEAGWEWTCTPFKPFQGFKPDPLYPEYSTDFFDNLHFVLKGSSPYTHPSMRRGSFRNFYQRLYPHVTAKFRVAKDI